VEVVEVMGVVGLVRVVEVVEAAEVLEVSEVVQALDCPGEHVPVSSQSRCLTDRAKPIAPPQAGDNALYGFNLPMRHLFQKTSVNKRTISTCSF